MYCREKYYYQNFIGCCILIFIHSGVNGVASAAMPQLKIYYGTDLTNIIIGASICCIAVFLSSFYGAAFIKFFHPKNAFYIGSGCGMIFSLLIASTSFIYMFYLGCACAGLMVGWGTFATCNIYIDRFYYQHRSIYVSILSMMAMLGASIFQFMSGWILSYTSVDNLYRIMGIFCFLAILVNKKFITPINTYKSLPVLDAKNQKKRCFMPFFIRMTLVVFLGSALTGTFGSLCTTFLQVNEISASMSAIYLSLYTLLGGFFALFSGWIADKFGWKCYVLLIYISFMIGMICACIWNLKSEFFTMMVMILFTAFAMPTATTYNMLPSPLFKEHALWAHTKLMSMGYLGSTLLLPFFSKIYEYYGFYCVWISLFMLAGISIVLLIPVVCSLRKENNHI